MNAWGNPPQQHPQQYAPQQHPPQQQPYPDDLRADFQQNPNGPQGPQNSQNPQAPDPVALQAGFHMNARPAPTRRQSAFSRLLSKVNWLAPFVMLFGGLLPIVRLTGQVEPGPWIIPCVLCMLLAIPTWFTVKRGWNKWTIFILTVAPAFPMLAHSLASGLMG